MKVLILGSGLLGVTTAYVLASRGHPVEVIERQGKSGLETSFANGGQLSYSHAEPWACPHVLTKLPKWLTHADSPLVFRPRADMDMYLWGLRFLRNCTPGRAERNCIDILRLSLYSRLKMQEIMTATHVEFDYIAQGILHLFSSERELAGAIKQMDFQAKFGCEQRVLSAQETLELEPTLADNATPIVGAIHSHMDASGDAHKFCVELAKYCAEKLGVVFHYETGIMQIAAADDRIAYVESEKGKHTADAYVMALGSYSSPFLRGLGITVPVYPMKGYSITVPANEHAPRVSVTDGRHKIVFSRLGNQLRVAGTAEFAGYDDTIAERRIAPIANAARQIFPKVDWDTRLHEWACLRPQTPTGRPLLGPSPIVNLFLNTGHGTLGWTHAAGSAYIVADAMENRPPEITTGGLTLATQ